MGDGPAAATPRAHGADFATAAEIVQEPVMDAVFTVPEPRNEPVRDYAPGSPERDSLQRRLAELAGERLDLTMTIDGEQRMGGGDADRRRPAAPATGTCSASPTTRPTPMRAAAVTAAKQAAPMWRALPYEERAAIFLRAADLLAGPWRDTLNARDHARPVEDRATRPRSTRPAS